MSTKVIVGGLQIARDSQNNINIEVQCTDSLVKFLTIELTAEQFGMLVTGFRQSDVKMEVRGLENVGKLRVLEQRQVFCPLHSYSKSELEAWVVDHCQEDGWVLNKYLGSQGSVVRVDKGCLLNYSVTKWVESGQDK